MMNKLSNYWQRWCLCYRENGLKYTIKKTIGRVKSRLTGKIIEQNDNAIRKENGYISDGKIKVDPARLNVGIKIEGGVGDYIIAANYIYKFKQKYYIPAMVIDVFYVRNQEAAQSILGEGLIDRQYLIVDGVAEESLYRKYDLFIRLSRYPVFQNRNPQKIQMYNPELLAYVQALEKFRWKNARFFDRGALFDGQSAMLSNIYDTKRIQQGDIDGLLEISEEYEFSMKVRDNSEEYLRGIGLTADRYILIVASADARNGGVVNNKLWPEEYWNLLIEQIKAAYPQYKIVLIGDSSIHENTINVDLNLSGTTCFEDVKIIVRDAALLISSEGGMVHLRHALTDKKSLVLFGPTDMEFYGYSNNINIRSSVCKYACEWICKEWFHHCVHKELKACMWALTPKMVMKEVDKFFEEISSNG